MSFLSPKPKPVCFKIDGLWPKHNSDRSSGKRSRVLLDSAAAIFSVRLTDSPNGAELTVGSGVLWSGLLFRRCGGHSESYSHGILLVMFWLAEAALESDWHPQTFCLEAFKSDHYVGHVMWCCTGPCKRKVLLFKLQVLKDRPVQFICYFFFLQKSNSRHYFSVIQIF